MFSAENTVVNRTRSNPHPQEIQRLVKKTGDYRKTSTIITKYGECCKGIMQGDGDTPFLYLSFSISNNLFLILPHLFVFNTFLNSFIEI